MSDDNLSNLISKLHLSQKKDNLQEEIKYRTLIAQEYYSKNEFEKARLNLKKA